MTDPSSLIDRKPARKLMDVPKDVLHWLNRGVLSTKNLTEWLAIDHVTLLEHCLPEDWDTRVSIIQEEIYQLKQPSTLKITKLVGSNLAKLAAGQAELNELKKHLLAHPSDSVRCYYGPLIGSLATPAEHGTHASLAQKLESLRPLAADQHFGCREVAFFSFKPAIVGQEATAIELLTPWVTDPDENIRRFAVETTRPIGVWTTHLPRLKERPDLGLPLLSPLKSDPARYVQNAVANWLNDAAKSKPDWVKELTKQWMLQSDTKATAYIVRRGKRSL